MPGLAGPEWVCRLMAERAATSEPASRFYYGWVIVAAGCASLVMLDSVSYSYGVFFKPIAAEFHWSRAAVSGVYSAYMISHGLTSIALGWLADRVGPRKIMVICSFAAGLGVILTSQISELWQPYVTLGLITGLGMGGSFTIASATTARWFIRKRGLALGIVSAGVGLGTLIMAPLADLLITNFGWSLAYVYMGLLIWAVMLIAALFMKLPPPRIQPESVSEPAKTPRTGMSFRQALTSPLLWLLWFSYAFINFCVQAVTVHLVNYATDMGIATLAAASFISIIGLGSITGRLIMGTASDRIGSNTALIMCYATIGVALVWLLFARQPWAFYLFAIAYGFGYGGEIPQMAALVGRYFGLQAVAALVGMVISGANLGGALGSWSAGALFDATGSYQFAIIVAIGSSVLAITLSILLKRSGRPLPQPATVRGI